MSRPSSRLLVAVALASCSVDSRETLVSEQALQSADAGPEQQPGPDTPIPDGEMRLYYRDQFKPSTQVAHGKTHVAKWPIPEGVKGKAVIRLTYALNPEELGFGRVTEVHRAEVEIK